MNFEFRLSNRRFLHYLSKGQSMRSLFFDANTNYRNRVYVFRNGEGKGEIVKGRIEIVENDELDEVGALKLADDSPPYFHATVHVPSNTFHALLKYDEINSKCAIGLDFSDILNSNGLKYHGGGEFKWNADVEWALIANTVKISLVNKDELGNWLDEYLSREQTSIDDYKL